jgi:hypothetical protein
VTMPRWLIVLVAILVVLTILWLIGHPIRIG